MKKLLLTLALVVGMTASAQKTTDYYFFLDLTAPELIEPFKDQIMMKLREDLGGKEFKRLEKDNGCHGVKVTIVPITDIPFVQPKAVSIMAGGDDCSWYANPADREDAVKYFRNKLNKAIGHFEYGEGYANTRIHETVSGELSKIKPETKVYILSDMIENGFEFSMLNSYPKNVDGTYESIKDLDVILIQGVDSEIDIKFLDYALMFWTKVFPGSKYERIQL